MLDSKCFPAIFLCSLLAALPAAAENRVFAVLFGPAQPATLQQAAPTAALRGAGWLQSPDTEIELRRPGTRDGQELTKFMQPKALEQAFLDAARTGGGSQLRPFLDGLELAIFSQARHAGTRYLVAALETPALTEDDVARLQQIAESARSSHVQVFVVDLSPPRRPGR